MFNLISSLGIGAGQSIWNIIINIFSFRLYKYITILPYKNKKIKH